MAAALENTGAISTAFMGACSPTDGAADAMMTAEGKTDRAQLSKLVMKKRGKS
ncbi:hypothetical protein [Desulfitobacterium sp. PCE1]|uniref:hypothetical protein n=1 Tax=Desulfitobacterium sp. PCE1 TaxID=146907 RepID=UPI00036A7F48|nr:hypothetical protein [Desulfitobacterium sp. PCE1]